MIQIGDDRFPYDTPTELAFEHDDDRPDGDPGPTAGGRRRGQAPGDLRRSRVAGRPHRRHRRQLVLQRRHPGDPHLRPALRRAGLVAVQRPARRQGDRLPQGDGPRRPRCGGQRARALPARQRRRHRDQHLVVALPGAHLSRGDARLGLRLLGIDLHRARRHHHAGRALGHARRWPTRPRPISPSRCRRSRSWPDTGASTPSSTRSTATPRSSSAAGWSTRP